MRAGDVFSINILFFLGSYASTFSVCRCDRGLQHPSSLFSRQPPFLVARRHRFAQDVTFPCRREVSECIWVEPHSESPVKRLTWEACSLPFCLLSSFCLECGHKGWICSGYNGTMSHAKKLNIHMDDGQPVYEDKTRPQPAAACPGNQPFTPSGQPGEPVCRKSRG